METARMTRQEFYEELWQNPGTAIAKKYGINFDRIAKLCNKYDIPRPPAGYWMQLKHGYVMERPPLPPAPKPELERIVIESMEPDRKARARRNAYPPVAVPDRLTSPHPQVSAAVAYLRAAKPDREGRVHTYGSELLRIAVTPASISRAARLLNVFVKEMEAEGIRFVPKDKQYLGPEGIVLQSGKEHFPLRLTEQMTRTTPPLTREQEEEMKKWGHVLGPRDELVPNGDLLITIGHDHWHPVTARDSPTTKIEARMGEIIGRAKDYITAELQRVQQLEAKRARDAKLLAEQQQREAERERLRQQERDRIKRLRTALARRRRRQEILTYIAEVKAMVHQKNLKIVPGCELDQWLRWAENYAERIDPWKLLRQQMNKLLEGSETINGFDCGL